MIPTSPSPPFVCPHCRRDLVPGQSTFSAPRPPQFPFTPIPGETPTSGFTFFLLAFVLFLFSLLLMPIGTPLLVVITSIWVAFDAGTHKLAQYQQGLGGPVGACLGSLLLWIVAFPWYLAVRSRIRPGVQPVKA